MNEWLHATLQASWQGGAAIVAAWVLTRWCTFLSPRVGCWIWRLACLKLLVCIAVNWFGIQAVAIPMLSADQPASIAIISETPRSATKAVEFSAQPVASELAPPSTRTLPSIAAPHPSNSNWLLRVWLAGVGCAVMLTIVRLRLVRRLCRASQPLQIAKLETLCREEAARLGLKRLPRIRTSPQTGAPLLAGICRPVLLLPASAIAEFNQRELRLMLAHELAHLKRRDLLWNWLPTVAGWLFFFHPLVWLLKHCWAAAQESACDELVLQSRTGETAAYARLLIKAAARWPQEPSAALMAAGVLGSYRSLRRRILVIARIKAVSRRRLLFAGAILSLVATLSIVPWRLVAQEPKAESKSEPVASAESKTQPLVDHPHGQWLGATVKSATPQIIVAEHVLLWDNQIVTWDEIMKRFRKMRVAGPFRAAFYLTRGADLKKDRGWQFWHDRIMSVYRKFFEPVGVTFGGINPRRGKMLDSIHTQADLEPDPAHKRTGTLLGIDGKPVGGAQVVIVADKSMLAVMLNGFELRDPLDEQWGWTDDSGKFTVYPENGNYWIAALHPTGFICQRAPAPANDAAMTLQLQRWATVTLASTGDATGQWASISDRPISGQDFPIFEVNGLEAKGDPIEVRMPAGKIEIQRFLKTERGMSIAAPLKPLFKFSVGPGERRAMTIAALDAAGRAAAIAAHDELMARFEGRAVGNPKAPAAPKPSPKASPASGDAPGGKKTSPGASLHDAAEIQRKTIPLLAAMAKDHGYRLDDGQVLRRIPPPYPAIRNELFRVTHPMQFEYLRSRFGAGSQEEQNHEAQILGHAVKLFRPHGQSLEDAGGSFGGDSEAISSLLSLLADIEPQWVDGPKALLETRVVGDWIVREGASDEQIVDALNAILRSELSLRVRMEFRRVPRLVYVADGKYRYQPLADWPDQNRERRADFIEIYAKNLAKGEVHGGDGEIKFPEFLDWIGRWINMPIVSDVKAPPKKKISVNYNMQHPITRATLAEDHDPALVLPNITAQTGLMFHKETRTVRILFIEGTK